MREASRTTRQRMTDSLREDEHSAAALAREFDVTVAETLSHVEHIAKSLEGSDEQLLVAPPACRDCGFDRFEDPANRPSRCPECKSEDVTDPVFRVE